MATLDNFDQYFIKSMTFKPTLACNCACSYCYFYSGDQGHDSCDLSLMPTETFNDALNGYLQLVQKFPTRYQSTIGITIHGGEPLLAGIDYFKKLFRITKKFEDQGLSFFYDIQTNGILLDNQWGQFLKQNNVSVGISIDGPESLHELHRKAKNGQPHFHKVLGAIEILKAYRIPYGGLAVLTEDSLSYKGNYLSFFAQLGIPLLDILPAFYNAEDDLSSATQGDDFFIQLFNEWYPIRDRITVTLFSDIIKKIELFQGKRRSVSILCELTGQCGRNISILPNGDVFPCECLTSLSRMRLGNIYETPLPEIFDSKVFFEFQNIANTVSDACFCCDVFDICKAGCLARRIPERSNSSNHKDSHCSARKKLIRHIIQRVNADDALQRTAAGGDYASA